MIVLKIIVWHFLFRWYFWIRLDAEFVFSKWVQVFAGDKIVTTAILDRVLHHSHIINIQGDSYRLKEKKQTGVLHSEIYKFEAKSSNLEGQNSEVV